MATSHPETHDAKSISLIGIPLDANASYRRGSAEAPQAIREALYSPSSNLWTEEGIDLGTGKVFHDAGDLALADDVEVAFAAIQTGVGWALDRGHPLLCLGGDHSVTYPTLQAFHARYPDLTILHFDAHPDLYDEFEGNRLSHACPFARILEERLARRLVQVGIRTMNRQQLLQANKFGVEVLTMRNLHRFSELSWEAPLFVSLDVDVLDPAFAPGVSHYEPGGMSVREILHCLQRLNVRVVGADLVEYNPTCDYRAQTAMVCAKLLKELAAAMIRGGHPCSSDWP